MTFNRITNALGVLFAAAVIGFCGVAVFLNAAAS